jgi:uncharacterized surface protein with fasciclin (FAS1) repeats
MKRIGFLSTGAAVVAITLSAAGGVQAQEPAAPGVTPAQPGATTATIMTEAEARGFGEWTRGVQATGLQQQLVDRPHTVFVADDAAFQQVPAAQRQAWQTDPAAQRAAFGHTIVEGRLTLDDLRTRQYVTTIDGQRLAVRVEGDRVWVGDAVIREGDIAAGTGTIHQLDRVLLPAAQPGQPGMQPGAQPGMQPAPAQQPVREPVRKN